MSAPCQNSAGHPGSKIYTHYRYEIGHNEFLYTQVIRSNRKKICQ